MDSIEFTEKIFRNLSDDGFFVNASVFADSIMMKLIEKCNYLSAILSNEGSPVYSFEQFLENKQVFTPQMTLLPSIFLKENSISTSTHESKAIVLLASPFATIKDSIRLFLSNISYSKVCLYFTSDCEIIMQNNLNGADFGSNLDKLINPLPYITECVNQPNTTIEAYSLGINVLPLLSNSYLKTNIFSFTDTSLQVEPYNRSTGFSLIIPSSLDNWVISILRFLYTYDFNVTDYIFYLGYDSKQIAQMLQESFHSKSDNNGYALLIADHSIDLLSAVSHSHATDLHSFLQTLSVFPHSFQHSSYQEYSILESEEELILKEWIKKEGNQQPYRDGGFIESTCQYIEDICTTKHISFEKHPPSLQTLSYLNNLLIHSSLQTEYYELTSLLHRYIDQVQHEEITCSHDFFDSINDIISNIIDPINWLVSFYVQPCCLCDSLPTIGDLLDMIFLLAFNQKMTSCTREELVSLLTMCCLQSQPEQICPVNRIISNEMCIELCKKEEKAIRDCCNSICSENNTFMKIFDQVSLYKSKIHSEWFSTNQGHFIYNIMQCADQPSNATDDSNVKCCTDIYTTKIPKPQPVNQGYLSFLRSFISVEHESIMKEREGIIIVSLDGFYDREIIELFSEMKKRNDSGVRDLILLSYQFGKQAHICDLVKV